MSLVKISYSEFENEPRYWAISDATFSNINLIVGKNASGKSRLLHVTYSFAQVITGKRIPHEPSKFSAVIIINDREFFYEIEFEGGAVISELLKVNGKEKLVRRKDGEGSLFYEAKGEAIEFTQPKHSIAVVNRLDEKQHPFLVELHQWACAVVMYEFGSDFGKSQVMGLNEVAAFMNSPESKRLDNPNNLAKTYTAAYDMFGENFDKAIIADMKELGYSLNDVGSANLQEITKFPIPALGMFIIEDDIDFKNPQTHISQGMYRALALIVNLNLCAFSKNKQVILVDDIGEGLDYERAVAIIDLLISKTKANKLQLIMTSNDRFVMNSVPLEYWSILKREGSNIKLFNYQNSMERFDKFKYLGLSNFDFFASDFLESGSVDG